jgi:hypothetical protein
MIDPLDFGGDRGTPEQRREGLVDSLSDAIFRVSLLPKESPYLEMAAELERRKRAAENGRTSGNVTMPKSSRQHVLGGRSSQRMSERRNSRIYGRN